MSLQKRIMLTELDIYVFSIITAAGGILIPWGTIRPVVNSNMVYLLPLILYLQFLNNV